MEGRGDGYEAIPYGFNQVGRQLQNDVGAVIEKVSAWRRKRDRRYKWEGARLIKNIFPAFGKELENALVELMKSGEKMAKQVLLEILDCYDGECFLHGVCREAVKIYGQDEKYRRRLIWRLAKTGTVCGEYGFVEAYRKKLEEINHWRKEEDKNVLLFVQEYEKHLRARIETEEKDAHESLELHQRGLYSL